MINSDEIANDLIRLGTRFFQSYRLDPHEAMELTMDALLKFHLNYDSAKARTLDNPERAFFKTQLRFTLLQYWNKQRPVVGTKIKRDKNGDPVLDTNGDPVMESNRATIQPFGEGTVDPEEDDDDPAGKMGRRTGETDIADSLDEFDTPRPEDPAIETVHYKGRSIALNAIGDIFQYYMLSGRSMKRYFQLHKQAKEFLPAAATRPEWRKLSGDALLELQRLQAFCNQAHWKASD